MRCWISSSGERHEYWICANRGGRLSDVASPAASTNSLRVQVPVCGNIASLVYLVVVYIRHSASIAPGQRAVACGPADGSSEASIHVSGSGVSKVNTTLQYDPQCVSWQTVLSRCGW